jgi:hypothetical protein
MGNLSRIMRHIYSAYTMYFNIKRKKYRVFVESIMDEEYKSPLSERLHSVILGSQVFIDEIKASFLKNR